MYDEHGLISTGTAFFYVHEEKWFLITNWHNLSGWNFLTKEPLPIGRFPTYIKAKISSYISSGEPMETKGFVPTALKRGYVRVSGFFFIFWQLGHV